MQLLCCGDAGAGITIYIVSNPFLGVVGIVLVVGSTLGSEVGFAGKLSSCFSFGAVLSGSTLGDPPIFTLRGSDMVGCIFSSCLGVG